MPGNFQRWPVVSRFFIGSSWWRFKASAQAELAWLRYLLDSQIFSCFSSKFAKAYRQIVTTSDSYQKANYS